MADEVEDAPSISILQEDSSPKKPAQTPIRVKLLVSKSNEASPLSRQVSPGGGDEADPEDEEEDQLIDEDDETASIPAKRKAPPAKRKPRKKLAEDKNPQPSVASGEEGATNPPSEPPSVKSTPRKKPPPTKSTSVIKLKATPKLKLSGLNQTDDAMSEGHTGTAASSPATLQPSPEPEASTGQPSQPAPPPEEINLEGVPIPVYPLPSKPFPVMPPVKIATGFSTAIPLEKNTAKVRRWRVAQREIRGIGGGRFFARCWVGARDSDYATAKETEKPAPSVSAPAPKRSKPVAKNPLPNVPSLVPSRSSSTAPETSATVPLTKMRNIVQAEPTPQDGDNASEAG